MSITVERTYRVTIDGEARTFSGEEAECLAFGLLTALGITTHAAPNPRVRPVPMAVPPQAALPSGSVAATEASPNLTASRTERFSGIPWQPADTERLRVLAGEGKTGPQIAALMGRPKGTIGAQAHKHHIPLGGGRRGPRVVSLPEIAAMPEEPPPPVTITPTAEADREPTVSVDTPAAPHVVRIRETDPLAAQILTGPLREWTAADTSRLIKIMAPATTKAEIEAAAAKAARTLDRTAMSCKNRWGHLKGAGRMTIKKYLSDPESLPEHEGMTA